jgi:tripartite-type tricarboxylate transporter receptor subunit TctC
MSLTGAMTTTFPGGSLKALLASALVAWTMSASPAAAGADGIGDDFYQGKQLRLIIGVGPGEAYDIYARLLARHMPKHLPGQPTIIAQNQTGAGSLTAINSLYNRAPRDGTVFGTGNRFVPMMSLLSMDGALFDPLALSYIGSMNRETGICLAIKMTGFHTVDDMKKREIIVGTVGAGAELTHFTSTLRQLLGLKMKLIAGYRTSNDINTAMDQGELDGRCGVSYSGLKTTRQDWLTNEEIDIQLQLGLRKDKELPDTPLIIDLVADTQDRQALELMLAPAEMGRPFFGPPYLPPKRLEALRAAFDASMTDDALLRDAEKQKLDITPMSGADMAALVARLYQAPTSIVERARVLAHTGD